MFISSVLSDLIFKLITVDVLFWFFSQLLKFFSLSYILTYIFGHYNLLQVLASANLRRHTSRAVAAWRQFRIPSVLRFSSTCLAQRWGGRPCLRHPPAGSESKTLRVGAIHTSDMTQPSTLYFNTLHYVDVIVYIVQLLVPSYAPFSSIAERSINLT